MPSRHNCLNLLRTCLLALSGILVSLLPAAEARAAIVTVTTHSTGFIEPDPVIMAALDLSYTGPGRLPFSMAARSAFDPDSVGYANSGGYAFAFHSDFSVDMVIGGQIFQHAGNYWSQVRRFDFGPDREGYEQLVGWDLPRSPGFAIGIMQQLTWPAAFSEIAQPLAPGSIGPDPALEGYMILSLYPLNPEMPGMRHMVGATTSFAVQIMAAVPEPALASMFSAGLLVLVFVLFARRRAMKPGDGRPNHASRPLWTVRSIFV